MKNEKKEEKPVRRARGLQEQKIDDKDTALFNEMNVIIAENRQIPYDLDSSNKKKNNLI